MSLLIKAKYNDYKFSESLYKIDYSNLSTYIKNITLYLINKNYILKKINYTIEKKSLYFVNKDNSSEIIKIIINTYKINKNNYKTNISVTIPLKKCNYLYTSEFNYINKVLDYLKIHFD